MSPAEPPSPPPQGSFRSIPIEEVCFGPASVAKLPATLERLGARRVLIVASGTLAHDPHLIGRIEASIGGRLAGRFAELQPHVPRRGALAAAAAARHCGADALLSFGGSTAHDTAKGAALALAEGLAEPADFDRFAIRFEPGGRRVVPPLTGTAPPLLAVPTTLSAGEFTNIAGLTDETRRHKDLYQDRGLACRAVFLDPELTLATPDWLWLSSGVKAIDHCVEALLSLSAQPMTDALALHALATLFHRLPATRHKPGDLAARGHCQVAAWLSVAGLGNVSLGLSHGLGHQLGAIAGVPHGYTSCVLLQHVLGFNRPATASIQARLADAIGLPPAASAEDGARALQAAMLRLVRDELALPWRLRDMGVERGDLARIAEAGLHDPIVATNPVPIGSAAEVLRLLEEAW